MNDDDDDGDDDDSYRSQGVLQRNDDGQNLAGNAEYKQATVN